MNDYHDILARRVAAIMAGTQGQVAQSEEIDDGVRVTGESLTNLIAERYFPSQILA